MNVIGTYEVIGEVEVLPSITVPLVDIPMMSDEKWVELTRKQAIVNYTKVCGHAPSSVEEAFKWQRNWIKEMYEH